MIFNLLIVDDEAPIRKGLSEYIKWEDYDCKVVATANNGEDAITKINENDINIVLTDVNATFRRNWSCKIHSRESS